MANDENTIFECCERNDVEGLKAYIQLGADINININAKDRRGYLGKHLHAHRRGFTPLHIAAWYNSKECLKLLLEEGAEINVTNDYGETPLHFAARYNSKECLHLLL